MGYLGQQQLILTSLLQNERNYFTSHHSFSRWHLLEARLNPRGQFQLCLVPCITQLSGVAQALNLYSGQGSRRDSAFNELDFCLPFIVKLMNGIPFFGLNSLCRHHGKNTCFVVYNLFWHSWNILHSLLIYCLDDLFFCLSNSRCLLWHCSCQPDTCVELIPL